MFLLLDVFSALEGTLIDFSFISPEKCTPEMLRISLNWTNADGLQQTIKFRKLAIVY